MHRRSLLRREPRRRRPEGRDSGCAKLKQLADAAGMTLCGYLAQMIAERVADVELEEYLNACMDDQYQRNLKKRKYQDEKTASGYYRVKHPKKRGRPPKPKKRGRPPKKIRKTRSDKGIPRVANVKLKIENGKFGDESFTPVVAPVAVPDAAPVSVPAAAPVVNEVQN